MRAVAGRARVPHVAGRPAASGAAGRHARTGSAAERLRGRHDPGLVRARGHDRDRHRSLCERALQPETDGPHRRLERTRHLSDDAAREGHAVRVQRGGSAHAGPGRDHAEDDDGACAPRGQHRVRADRAERQRDRRGLGHSTRHLPLQRRRGQPDALRRVCQRDGRVLPGRRADLEGRPRPVRLPVRLRGRHAARLHDARGHAALLGRPRPDGGHERRRHGTERRAQPAGERPHGRLERPEHRHPGQDDERLPLPDHNLGEARRRLSRHEPARQHPAHARRRDQLPDGRPEHAGDGRPVDAAHGPLHHDQRRRLALDLRRDERDRHGAEGLFLHRRLRAALCRAAPGSDGHPEAQGRAGGFLPLRRRDRADRGIEPAACRADEAAPQQPHRRERDEIRPDPSHGGELLLRERRHDRRLRARERHEDAGPHARLAQPEPRLAVQGRRRQRPAADAREQGADAAAARSAHPHRRGPLQRRGHLLGRGQRGDRREPAGRPAAHPLVRAHRHRLHRPRLPGRARGRGPGRQARHQ